MNLKLNLQYSIYPDLTQPHGFLERDKACQACWFFYTLAEQLRSKVGSSIDDQFGILEDYPWMDKRYVDIAKSVAMLYQLNDPDEFAKYWPLIRKQALSMGYPEPSVEYTKQIQRFIIN